MKYMPCKHRTWVWPPESRLQRKKTCNPEAREWITGARRPPKARLGVLWAGESPCAPKQDGCCPENDPWCLTLVYTHACMHTLHTLKPEQDNTKGFWASPQLLSMFFYHTHYWEQKTCQPSWLWLIRALVAQACSPGCWGGWERGFARWRPAWATFWDPVSKSQTTTIATRRACDSSVAGLLCMCKAWRSILSTGKEITIFKNCGFQGSPE